ncbi:hypothetical protein [Sphingobium yanoikuyae]|jgi:hypothetical protein|uniref:hypothetical protein n=2 Tax=Sphingomonadaceae TaxID=41297 RepID=UPI00241D079A|nr:hypothetical protein [Sphingobium yanoikuyae]
MARADDDIVVPKTYGESPMDTNEQGEAFGAWLLKQAGRDDWIGTLAKQAKNDPKFQKSLTPDDLRKRLHDAGAEGDSFEALDDAEAEWLNA